MDEKNMCQSSIEQAKNLCRNMKRLREKERLTEEEMAKICNISVPELRDLERGKINSTIGVELLFLVAKHFQLENGGVLFYPME